MAPHSQNPPVLTLDSHATGDLGAGLSPPTHKPHAGKWGRGGAPRSQVSSWEGVKLGIVSVF